MHPILNGYIAREMIARRQAEREAWSRRHPQPREPAPDADPATRRRHALVRRLLGD
jgi:hypothetical protein